MFLVVAWDYNSIALYDLVFLNDINESMCFIMNDAF